MPTNDEHCRSAIFYLLVGMGPFRPFRLLAEPDAVIDGSVCSIPNEHYFPIGSYARKNHLLIGRD